MKHHGQGHKVETDMHSKCPSCGETIKQLLGESIPVKSVQPKHRAMTYRCPGCNIAIGCGADLEELQREVVTAIEDAFRRRAMY